MSKYANPLLDTLDPEHFIQHRLFRDSCKVTSKGFVKDLSLLGRQLKDIVIIDNTPVAYSLQPLNALPIKTWTEDREDTQLKDLLPIVKLLSKAYDVRDYLKKIVKEEKVDCESAVKLLKSELTTKKPIEPGIRLINRWIAQQEKASSKFVKKAQQPHLSSKTSQTAIRPELSTLRKPTAGQTGRQNPARCIRKLAVTDHNSENDTPNDMPEILPKAKLHRELTCRGSVGLEGADAESVPAISGFKGPRNTPCKRVNSIMMKQCVASLAPCAAEMPEEVYSRRNFKLYDTISKDMNTKGNFNRRKFVVKRVNNSEIAGNAKDLTISLQNEDLYKSIQAECRKSLITAVSKKLHPWAPSEGVPSVEAKREEGAGRMCSLPKAARLYRVVANRESGVISEVCCGDV
eukprot:TRINITY_DN11067_c0_g3_i4.p1 TRINITY_DN11067_c0_g3~~TRINITY_DN11067_c0_g3_i4.p1  ORF type:complete len:404 (+),score=93.23 TRINITY_DN11067_c0_g3_i4:665-1876(+)